MSKSLSQDIHRGTETGQIHQPKAWTFLGFIFSSRLKKLTKNLWLINQPIATRGLRMLDGLFHLFTIPAGLWTQYKTV